MVLGLSVRNDVDGIGNISVDFRAQGGDWISFSNDQFNPSGFDFKDADIYELKLGEDFDGVINSFETFTGVISYSIDQDAAIGKLKFSLKL